MSVVRKVNAAAEVAASDEYILSDESVDRYGDVIKLSAWRLANFKRNPIVLFNHDNNFPIGRWEDVGVRDGALRARFVPAARGTSARIDEINSLREQGILKATSVGFKPLKAEPRSGGRGVDYTEAELLETSIVSVPANPNALHVAKSLNISDDTIALVFGKHAEEPVSRTMGKQAPSHEHHSKGAKPMKLSERIVEAQDNLVSLRDQLTDITKSADYDVDEADGLVDQIDALERQIGGWKRAEGALAAKSVPVSEVKAEPSARRPFSMAAKSTQPRDLIFRLAAVNALAFATGKDVETVAQQRYPGDEGMALVAKAAVSGATTTTAGWAAELVNTAMTDFLESLRPISVYPTLAELGGGRLDFGPNQGAIKIPSRSATPSIGGSFVGEGAPIPVRRLGLTSVTLSPKKMGVISVFSREIARYSTPAIEGLLRREIEADTAATLDTLLLDNVAGSAVRPAGLLNGVSALTATTGGGYAAILGDLRKLRAVFSAVNSSRNLVILMNPAQEDALALTPGADGTLGWADSVLSRYKVISSTTVPVGRVIMVDASDFVTATGDVPEFELSNEALLHMEDTTPLQIATGAQGSGVLATPTQSMFQTAQIAIRMLLDVSWAMRRAGMVAYVDTVTW